MKQNDRIPELFLPRNPEIIRALEEARVQYRLPRCRACNPGTNLKQEPEGHGFKISCSCGNSWQQNTPLSVSIRMVSGAEKVAKQITTELRKVATRRMAVAKVLADGDDVIVQIKLDPFSPGAGLEAIIGGLAEPVKWFKHGLPGQLPSEILETSVPEDVRDVVETVKAQRRVLRQWTAPSELPAELCWQAACRVEHVAFASQDTVVLVADLGGNELEDGRPSAQGIPGVVYDAVRVVKVSASPTGVLIAPYRGAIDPETRLPIEVAEDDPPPGTVHEGHPAQADPRYRRVAWAAMKAAQEAQRGRVQVPMGWSVRPQGPRPQAPRPQQPRPQPAPVAEPVVQAPTISARMDEPPVGEPPPDLDIRHEDEEPMDVSTMSAMADAFRSEIPDPPTTIGGFETVIDAQIAKKTPRRRVTKPAAKTRKSRRSDD